MTNINEILKNLGIDIPEEKQNELTKAVAENYKTIVEVEKKISQLEADRDNWKEQAETATETLKGFDGKDFDAIQKERDEWKVKADNAKKEYEAKLYERDFTDALEKEIANIKFTSESAKKAVVEEIKNAGLKLADNKILGFGDLVSQIKTRDKSAFVDEKQEELEQNKARFTEGMNNNNGTMSKEAIMAIKDRGERQKAILENKSLFGIE